MLGDVFISYSTKEKALAYSVCAYLEAKGFACWIAPRNLLEGYDFGAAIVEAIEGCRLVVLLFSSAANASRQVRRELKVADDAQKTVVPVRIEDVRPTGSLAYLLGMTHWLEAVGDPKEEILRKLKNIVSNHLAVGHTPDRRKKITRFVQWFMTWSKTLRKLPVQAAKVGMELQYLLDRLSHDMDAHELNIRFVQVAKKALRVALHTTDNSGPTESISPAATEDALRAMLDELHLSLIHPKAGDRYNDAFHQFVKADLAPNAQYRGRISQVLYRGLTEGDRVICKAEVSLFD